MVGLNVTEYLQHSLCRVTVTSPTTSFADTAAAPRPARLSAPSNPRGLSPLNRSQAAAFRKGEIAALRQVIILLRKAIIDRLRLNEMSAQKKDQGPQPRSFFVT
jgi:hypothetical protein